MGLYETRTAARPIGMRLRTFGKDEEGKTTFLGDVLKVMVLGKPGAWVAFRAFGNVPQAEITIMDLHCSIRPDTVRTVQFLDDLRLELLTPPPLEMRLFRDAVWGDETALAVEVCVNEAKRETATLAFTNGECPGEVRGAMETATQNRDRGSPVA